MSSIWARKGGRSKLRFPLKHPNLRVTWAEGSEGEGEEEGSCLAAFRSSPLALCSDRRLQNRWLSQMGNWSVFHCGEKKCIFC